MNKLNLNVADLRVTSFETDEAGAAAEMVTGTLCLTRFTMYDNCCIG